MSADSSNYDAIVVGGGPAGAAAACHLAAAQRSVLLLEKEAAAHDKVCGEFISGEAQGYLAALGIDLATLGAVPIRRVRLMHGARIAESALPFGAIGLSRRRLDEALLGRAQAMGAEVRRGAMVRTIDHAANPAWRVATNDRSATAETIFLATGKHEVRQFKRVPATPDGLIGFKMYLRLDRMQTEALRDYIEVILFDGGYAGLQLIDPATANLCLLVRKSIFARMGKSWPALLDHLSRSCPPLGERLVGATPCWDAPLAIASVPFGFLGSDTARDAGLYRLGDQVSVIPAFSGNGISIALHTARLAAECYLQGRGAAAYLARVREDLRHTMSFAGGLSRITQHPWAQNLTVDACRMFPPLMAILARKTRIPHAA
jgi:flavin-dependent dehydrogenase